MPGGEKRGSIERTTAATEGVKVTSGSLKEKEVISANGGEKRGPAIILRKKPGSSSVGRVLQKGVPFPRPSEKKKKSFLRGAATCLQDFSTSGSKSLQ